LGASTTQDITLTDNDITSEGGEGLHAFNAAAKYGVSNQFITMDDNNITGAEGAVFWNVATETGDFPGTATQTIDATGNTFNATDGSEGFVAYNIAGAPGALATQNINLTDNRIGLDGVEGGLWLANSSTDGTKYFDDGGTAIQDVDLQDNDVRYAAIYNWADSDDDLPQVVTQLVDLEGNSFAEGIGIANGAEGGNSVTLQDVDFSAGGNSSGGTYIWNEVDDGGTGTQLVDLVGSGNSLDPVTCTGDATQIVDGATCGPEGGP
ncbi:MAG: hypothetical protein GY753_15330, partial [Gammaproteobacteria bacterium]|nr:hypothetical protein [Gammaproteobacteria bacterium]